MELYEVLKVLYKPVEFDNEIKLEHLTQDYIIELARKVPEIHHAISLYQVKTITWEQAVYLIIITLAQKNTKWEEMATELTNSNPPPVIIQSSIKLKRMIDEIPNDNGIRY